MKVTGWALECGDFGRSSPAQRIKETLKAIGSPRTAFNTITGNRTSHEAKQRVMRQWGLIPIVLMHLLSKRFGKQRFGRVYSLNKHVATLNSDKLLAPCLAVYGNDYSFQSIVPAVIKNGEPSLDYPLIVTSSDREMNREGMLHLYDRIKDTSLLKDLVYGLGKASVLQENLFSWCESTTASTYQTQFGSIEQAYAARHQRKEDRYCPPEAYHHDFFEGNQSTITKGRGTRRYITASDA